MLALALTGLLILTGPSRAAADPTETPVGSSLVVRGAGFGHGIGMSQYGAYGAARQGLTWREILRFYYPGTSLGTLPAGGTIRVWITADSDGDLRVRPAPGLRLVDADGRTAVLPASSRYRAWRLTRAGSGFRLAYQTASGRWVTRKSGLTSAAATFRTSSGMVAVGMPGGSLREYRGAASLVTSGRGARTVNRVGLEDYVRAVVPAEMPTSWAADAVRSQAVAARTYAARLRAWASPTAGYDICDTTACQVYRGLAATAGGRRVVRETAAGNAAVAATRDVVVRSGSQLALTMFSSANGGHSARGGYPYLTAHPDPYDGVVKTQTWTRTIRTAQIGARWSVGSVRAVQVVSRDGAGPWGGRVRSLRIVGSARTVTVSGTTFKYAFGLRDTLFTLGGDAEVTVPTPPPPTPRPAYVTFPRHYAPSSRADLVLVDPAGRLRRYPATGRSLGAPSSLGVGFDTYTHVAGAGDWNGDGYADVIARTKAGRLRLFPGTGSGALGRSRDLGVSAPFRALTGAGDVNGDGFPDLIAITRAGNLRLYPGDGRDGVGRSVKLASGWSGRQWLRGVGDLTGDARVDLVTRVGSRLYLHPGTRTGFAAPIALGIDTAGLASITSVGDFDGDERADLVARTTRGGLVLYRGTRAGRLAAAVPVSAGYRGYRFLV